MTRMTNAQEPLYGTADHIGDQRTRRRSFAGSFVPPARFVGGDVYKYKAKFGGMTVYDAPKLRTLEQENGRMKRLLAEAMLDNAALKDLVTKTTDL